ncbi:hypothetical protein D3C77_694950 [compost metagenome]
MSNTIFAVPGGKARAGVARSRTNTPSPPDSVTDGRSPNLTSRAAMAAGAITVSTPQRSSALVTMRSVASGGSGTWTTSVINAARSSMMVQGALS